MTYKPYYDGYGFEDAASILRSFEAPSDALDDCEVVFASYTYEDYTGDAKVLYRDKHGKIFEVNGGHCSCNGLEGQWDPEPFTLEELEFRYKDWRPDDIYPVEKSYYDGLHSCLAYLKETSKQQEESAA
jgi:hypothetical protein